MGTTGSKSEDYEHLFIAIHRGDTEDILELINSGLSTDQLIDSKSVLYRAIESGHPHVVKLLIDQGCDVNIGRTEETPLHLACRLGNMEILKLLLSSNIDVNKRNITDMSPVWCAALNGDLEILRHLLEHPFVDVNARSGSRCLPDMNKYTTPLIMSTRESRDDVTSLLCQHLSIDVNIADKQGRIALHYAVLNESDQSTHLLLEKGSRVNCVDETNITPIYIACKYGYSDIVRILLAAGADISISKSHNDTTEKGFYPMHTAVSNGHEDVVKILCETAPGMVDVKTSNLRTPLIMACQSGYRGIALTLLENGADPNISDFQHTPLMYALHRGSTFNDENKNRHSQLCRKYTETNFQKSTRFDNDKAQCDNYDILEHLIISGADLNCSGRVKFNEHTPGYLAVLVGSLTQCVIMMKYGAKIYPFNLKELSKIRNFDKLKALIQIDLRFREVAKTILILQESCHGCDNNSKHIIQSELSKPPNLKAQCRHVIRQSLLHNQYGMLHQQTQELPLPKLLKWYILLNDICDEFCIDSKYS